MNRINKVPASLPSESRRYPKRPFVGVGALIFRRSAVLMIERGKDPYKGYWSIPGGMVEPGEKLEAAVMREVKEETNLDVRVDFLAEIFERIMRDEKGVLEYHYVLIDYVCRLRGGELRAGEDAAKAEWIPMKRLAELPVTEGTRDVIERAYAEYQRRSARVRKP